MLENGEHGKYCHPSVLTRIICPFCVTLNIAFNFIERVSVRLAHQFTKEVVSGSNPRAGVEKLTPFLSDSKASVHEIYSAVKTSKLVREDGKFDPGLSYTSKFSYISKTAFEIIH